MSLSSTSSATGSATGRRAVRVAIGAALAVALLTPVAVLFTLVWSSTGDRMAFAADERRGVAYLGPLTRLLSVVTDAQAEAVSGKPINPEPVRAAIVEVDAIDAELGGQLRTTDRWTTIRGIIQERTGRRWNDTIEAYTQFSDLVTQLMELNRKVGDGSRLILDPQLDSYYVMNAALLRTPEILVDSGRYTDLSVLAAAGTDGPAGPGRATVRDSAALTAARNRVATNAIDLSDGLLKAFGSTSSTSLGPGLTRPLDDFRTSVDAVAPSNSLLAQPPVRSPTDLESDQNALQQAALALQEAALGELDRLLDARQNAAERTRLIAAGAALLGLLVAGAAAVTLRPGWAGGGTGADAADPADPDDADGPGGGSPGDGAAPRRRSRSPGVNGSARSPAAEPATSLVGVSPETGGGARAPR